MGAHICNEQLYNYATPDPVYPFALQQTAAELEGRITEAEQQLTQYRKLR